MSCETASYTSHEGQKVLAKNYSSFIYVDERQPGTDASLYTILP